MRAYTRVFIVLFSMLLPVYIHGQRLPFENFNVEKGLSQSQVTSITQDIRNYLWVGTIGGLNRFDGTRFKTFSKQDGLSSSYISCLYTSKKGDIWIGTTRGISYYNGHS
ncbi:MAG TPA: two-component regulator propeller domain-containing protein, partial [Niabella sp.]|nr:two-component regulator propeller domain-containing protein [Niabella sp.]